MSEATIAVDFYLKNIGSRHARMDIPVDPMYPCCGEVSTNQDVNSALHMHVFTKYYLQTDTTHIDL